MPLSLKHQLQRWTVHQLNRLGFTNITLTTPLPTRGDGSTFDLHADADPDSDLRPLSSPYAETLMADFRAGSESGSGGLVESEAGAVVSKAKVVGTVRRDGWSRSREGLGSGEGDEGDGFGFVGGRVLLFGALIGVLVLWVVGMVG
ncbi:hypothetical protein FQN53_004337 [Emmonsiellopsis sp. PD_33]|nr:hypothetical protein FQN53_004337 [Emmonsiellopsis sp. PD_33]KAK2801061.1 hypothetical protein FQN51_005625 [Onygenales sp. PD_10]